MQEQELSSVLENEKLNMEKVIEAFTQFLKKMKVGKASINLLDSIKVEYYGQLNPINQLANIKVESPQILIIEIWDLGAKKEIEKAIIRSPLGLNPIDQGNYLKIVIPPLTQETRLKVIKEMKEQLESYKQSIRNIRRDMNTHIKKEKKNISEDFIKRCENNVQNWTNDFIKKIDDLFLKKEKEIQKI